MALAKPVTPTSAYVFTGHTVQLDAPPKLYCPAAHNPLQLDEVIDDVAPYRPASSPGMPVDPQMKNTRRVFKFVRSTSKTAGHNFKKTEHNYS